MWKWCVQIFSVVLLVILYVWHVSASVQCPSFFWSDSQCIQQTEEPTSINGHPTLCEDPEADFKVLFHSPQPKKTSHYICIKSCCFPGVMFTMTGQKSVLVQVLTLLRPPFPLPLQISVSFLFLSGIGTQGKRLVYGRQRLINNIKLIIIIIIIIMKQLIKMARLRLNQVKMQVFWWSEKHVFLYRILAWFCNNPIMHLSKLRHFSTLFGRNRLQEFQSSAPRWGCGDMFEERCRVAGVQERSDRFVTVSSPHLGLGRMTVS